MPFAAQSHLPQCLAPCDPPSSCSFLWSWVQILSASINYLFGRESISVLVINVEKQGNTEEAGALPSPDVQETLGKGLWLL